MHKTCLLLPITLLFSLMGFSQTAERNPNNAALTYKTQFTPTYSKYQPGLTASANFPKQSEWESQPSAHRSKFDTRPDTTENFDHYGGNIGIGISILDGFGLPVRFYLTPQYVLEAGLYLGGTLIVNNDDTFDFNTALMAGGGFTFFGDRFEKVRKKKIRANGVALRFNQLTGDYSTSMFSLGWAMETFRKDRTNRSFIFELGLKQLVPHYIDLDTGETAKPSPTIYLRCHWNFFLG